MTTLRETLEKSVQKHGDKTLMLFKRDKVWQRWSFREFAEKVRNVSELLVRTCHVHPGDRVALMAGNSPEWCAIHYGITGIGATAVPVDVKLQEKEVCHVLGDSAAKALFMDGHGVENLGAVERRCPGLKHVLLFGNKPEVEEGGRVEVHDFDKAMKETEKASKGKGSAYERLRPKTEDVASLIYTSGTTGRQKGAMLTHGNFTSNFESLDAAIEILPDDNFFLLLPLHHAFAFTTCLVTPIASGTQISFAEGLRTISENLRETRPSIVLGVPLLLEKMYAKMRSGLAANKGVSLLWKLGVRGPVRKGLLEKLGGRLRLMVSGGAPIAKDLIDGMEELGLHPREGYGLTECSPVLTLTPYEGPVVEGSCGRVLPGIEMKVFEPNSEGVGELAARGGNIMKGYFNNPGATEDVFRDGWFLTGDLGFVDEQNFVHITGRKKALIVNREGKNIYPEEVEIQINASELIRECVVLGYREDGETVGEHVGVIVVPDDDGIAALEAREHKKLSERDILALMKAEVKAQVANLAEYKRPRRIQLRWEDFNKTSTGKIKRYLYAMATESSD